MARRYLFGPVTRNFADQNLRRHIENGECVMFDHDGPMSVEPFDTWQSLAARLSGDRQPDFLVLQLQYNTIPPVLWQASIPIVGLAGDWNLLWHHYRHLAPLCDLVLTDLAGVEKLARAGIAHAKYAQLFGCERAFVDWEYPAGPRDIDILFVGNFNPAVQRERLPWLGRIAKLKQRWNVNITTDVFGDEYRKLLGRTRIVVNRGIRGEWNCRAGETIAAGALLFQEAENQEVATLLRPGEGYIAYTDANLEELLDYYLEHEDERRGIAERATQGRSELTYEAFWDDTLAKIETAWPKLCERAEGRCADAASLGQPGRIWQLVSSTSGDDSTLVADLNEALTKHPRSAKLNNDLGVALWHRPQRDLARIAELFQAAWHADPRQIVARLNLTEVLVLMGRTNDAIDQATRTLAMLESLPTIPAEVLDAVHVPAGYDAFRVEWERAAWQNAGNQREEERSKRRLLRWRLCEILALLTNDPVHGFRMVEAAPDLAISLTQLGNALGRHRRLLEALPYLQRANELNPFDYVTARTYHQTLAGLGRTSESLRFAAHQRLVAEAAPKLVPTEPWFAEFPQPTIVVADKPAEPFRVVWQGAQAELHSLALVNREICERLIQRGHEVSLLEPPTPFPASHAAPLPQELRERIASTVAGPNVIHVAHQWPPDFTPPAERHWVLMQPWEWGSLPRAWLTPMRDQIDEVWVPSNFVRNTFLGSGLPADQVHVVPNGIAPVFFQKHDPFPLKTKKRFKFLFVGGTIKRKGIDLLLTAYEQCFSCHDDVCLVIKDMGVGSFYQGQTAEQHIAALRARPHAPEIEYHAEELSPDDMARLYAACDCLVHPYRGEGFGMPIAEALATGLPVIVTGFGAALDFCRDEAVYLIDAVAEILDKGQGQLETIQPQFWAKPDLDHLRCLLRHIVDHPDEARGKAQLGQTFVRQHFTWEHSVAAIEGRLRALQSRPIRRNQPRTATAVERTYDYPGAKPRVSLTMIVKNEEHNLADCLRSVADLVEEIIVVDTGSTDRTKEIAAQFGAKVHDFPWIDNFAAARNATLRYATGDWIFWMDADDRLDAENRERLRAVFAKLPNGEIAGFNMKCSCLPGPESDSPTVVDHVRLFPNHPQIRWKYRIHEQILVAIRKLGGQVRWSDVVIQHVGYQDAEVHRRKGDRNFRLLQLDYQDHPDDPYTLFNLGNMLHEQRRFQEAILVLRRSLQSSAPSDSIVRKLYSLIVQCQHELGELGAALETCREGRGLYPNDPELLFVESIVRHRQGDRCGAIDCLRMLRQSYQDNHFASLDTGLRTHKACHNLGILFHEEGRLAEAEQHWRSALATAPKFVPASVSLADLYLKQQRFDDLESLIGQLERFPQGSAEVPLIRARQMLARCEFGAAKAAVRELIRECPTALPPRVVLTHILLQEANDSVAAEQALRDVLALDANHAEARRNLAVLLEQWNSGD